MAYNNEAPARKATPKTMGTDRIYTTEDYFLFKPIEGNRNINLVHINHLKKSMKEQYLRTVITVNEKYEIIDGQHRFEVIRELGLPLRYEVCEGYGLQEVHRLNQNSKTWNADDYLSGYCKMGLSDYEMYKDFQDQYGLGHGESMAILSGKNRKNVYEEFRTGTFKVINYDKSSEIADQIFRIAPYYEGFKRRSFVFAMVSLLDNENFDMEEFLQKLRLQPMALVDCTSQTQYLALIEKIYNYRRRDKVNLRY